jgi:hypothetical protein
MNMNDFYFEADYSNYDGSELNESNYFAQGGLEAAMQNVVEPLDRTLTFRVTNAGPGAPAVAILFDGNVSPLAQPAGVTVTVAETGGGAGSHDQVRVETLGNPFVIQGLRYFVGNAQQFGNAFTIQKRFPTGKLIQYLWQPTNYVSPTNLNPLVIDAIDFGLVVDGRTSIQVPVDFSPPAATIITLVFTLKAKTSNAHMLFGKNPKELAVAPRIVGNPVADIALMRSQPRNLGM